MRIIKDADTWENKINTNEKGFQNGVYIVYYYQQVLDCAQQKIVVENIVSKNLLYIQALEDYSQFQVEL